MPRFSIILPTYNRADTVLRAIASIRAQTFADWELLVVDDGSTDGTAERLAGLDPRLRLLRQENQGVTAARNTGLAAASGELVAFLDSDDEWLPYHLALASAFFEAHPGEDLYTTEFWEDFGNGSYLKHHQVEMAVYAPYVARRIGSRAFAAPPPEGDGYLRFYQSREPAGAWALPAGQKAFHYRGNLFRGWRWEFLMAMQSTVLTRKALAAVGPADPSIRVASDYGWLASLCRMFTANLISVPGCIKHEYGEQKRPLAEGHLVTGRTAVRFHQDMLRMFEELYLKDSPDDPELQGIRGYRRLLIAKAALLSGQRELAIEQLEQARHGYRALDAPALLWLARLVPHDAAAARTYALSRNLLSLPGRALRRLLRSAA